MLVDTAINRAISFAKYGVHPFIFGQPGIGKTAILQQECERRNYGLVYIQFGLLPEEMISGLPKIEGDSTKWTRPDIIRQAWEEHEKGYNYIVLFFDDLHLASKSMQKYFFEICTHKSIHGHKLPSNTLIIAAGNPGVKAGRQQFLSAIVNRFVFLHAFPSRRNWLNWAAYKSKQTLSKRLQQTPVKDTNDKPTKEDIINPEELPIHPLVIAFLSRDESEKYFVEEEKTEPHATPRSWEYVSRILHAYEKEILGENIVKAIGNKVIFHEVTKVVEGAIGPQSAKAFMQFLMYAQRINIKEIVKKPESLDKLSADEKFAAIAMLADYFSSAKKNPEELKQELERFLEFLYKRQYNMIFAYFIDLISRSERAPMIINLVVQKPEWYQTFMLLSSSAASV